MSEARPPQLEALTAALFETCAGSLWLRLSSAEIPDLAWPTPPRPVGVIDIHFTIPRRHGYRGMRLSAPGSDGPQPWGHAWGPTPADWAHTIRLWLEQQIASGCDTWARKDDDGVVAYFEITNKGLQPGDYAGPDGTWVNNDAW